MSNGDQFVIPKSSLNRNLSYSEVQKVLAYKTMRSLRLLSSGGLSYTRRREEKSFVKKAIKMSRELEDERYNRFDEFKRQDNWQSRDLTQKQWERYKKKYLNPRK